MLSLLWPIATTLVAAAVIALALYLRALLFDRFDHASRVLDELRISLRALQQTQDQMMERLEALANGQTSFAERLETLIHTQRDSAERLETLIHAQMDSAGRLATLARQLQEAQTRTAAALAELRDTLETQSCQPLSHLTWQEVERYVSGEDTPETERDFFTRLLARHRAEPR